MIKTNKKVNILLLATVKRWYDLQSNEKFILAGIIRGRDAAKHQSWRQPNVRISFFLKATHQKTPYRLVIHPRQFILAQFYLRKAKR